MIPLAWLLSLISGYCLYLAVAGKALEWWERRRPTVGCDCNDDCPDCRDVRNERV